VQPVASFPGSGGLASRPKGTINAQKYGILNLWNPSQADQGITAQTGFLPRTPNAPRRQRPKPHSILSDSDGAASMPGVHSSPLAHWHKKTSEPAAEGFSQGSPEREGELPSSDEQQI
jgi:hypothetical protein